MDSNILILFEAAREGKVEVLDRLLQENPSILASARLTSLGDSILHVATISRQLIFVNGLMRIDPDIARELNKEGFRPLDIAVIMGDLDIVRNILSFGCDLGRLAGKDNRTALHYAAIKGRVEIINELLSACPDCLEDITAHEETALHLAVKHYQFDAFAKLVKWLQRLRKESIMINIPDSDGNTVLHLAVSTREYECLNLLLDENTSIREKIDLNVRNGNGLTALDILDTVSQDSYDAKARELLRRGVGQQHDQPQSQNFGNWIEYFRFKKKRDSPGETRNAVLVIATLIVTVTFQAGANPSSGLFDTSNGLNSTDQSSPKLGVSDFTSDFMFLFFNTFAFTSSGLVIIYLTGGFPLYRELYSSILSMWATYGVATSLTFGGHKAEGRVLYVAYTLQFVAALLPYLMTWLPWWSKRPA